MITANPDDLWIWRHAVGGGAQVVNTVARANYSVIEAGDTFVSITNPFHTSGIVPAFTPSWNTQVWPSLVTDSVVEARFSVPAPNKSATFDYVLTPGTRQAVSSGAESATISHNLGDATTSVLVCPN